MNILSLFVFLKKNKTKNKFLISNFDKRFDLIAKILYIKARDKKYKTIFFKDLYLKHLEVWNGFFEKGTYTGQEKKGIKDFLNLFDKLIDSIKSKGFDLNESKIWVDKHGNLLNGAHRLATCLYYDLPFQTVVHPQNHGQLICDYKYLRDKKDFVNSGMPEDMLDRMALEYVHIKKTTYLLLLFPSAQGKIEKVENLIKDYSTIVYDKKVQLNQNGGFNLIKILYKGEKWVGSVQNNFEGAWAKVKPCFPDNLSTEPLKIYLIDSNNFNELKELKQKIRDIYKIGNHSVHITDTHNEAIEVAQSLFNENSIHFLNYSKLNKNQTDFLKYFDKFKNLLKKHNIDLEDICITSSAVLSVYGLRDCDDLDFITKENSNIKSFNRYIQTHNSQLKYYSTNFDEIIFNPDNYFYFQGVKFANLKILKNFKKIRNEGKDKKDIKLLKDLI